MLPEIDPPSAPPGATFDPGDADLDAPALLTVAALYDAHAALVWRTLRALGVDASRVDDAVQDVFVVVHRRLGDFEGRGAVTTWLYGIARRVAAGYRRRRESIPAIEEPPSAAASPLEVAEQREAARIVLAALDELDDDKREVFALIELEQLTAPVVAELLGIPLNTVYSRLRHARQRFEVALARRVAPEGNR